MRELMEAQMAASKVIVENGEEIMPHFVAWDRDNVCHVIATPWGYEAEKVQTLQRVRTFFVWKGVTRYIMVSEAWVIVRSVDSPDQREPRLCEDRRECITMMGVSHDGVIGCNALIAGEMPQRAVAEPTWQEEGTVGGRMAQLLPPPGFVLSPEVEAILAVFFEGDQIA